MLKLLDFYPKSMIQLRFSWFLFNLNFLILSYESNSFNSNKSERSISCSPIPAKRLKFDEDEEMAFILQIEEIVLSENKINETTIE